jgi:hypothetical protein
VKFGEISHQCNLLVSESCVSTKQLGLALEESVRVLALRKLTNYL